MFAFGMAHLVRLEALRTLKREAGFLELAKVEPLGQLAAARVELDEEEGSSLRKALRHLSEAERQVVLLHIDQELTLSEIGTLLEMPLGTVKSHVSRAKEKLREILVNH